MKETGYSLGELLEMDAAQLGELAGDVEDWLRLRAEAVKEAQG